MTMKARMMTLALPLLVAGCAGTDAETADPIADDPAAVAAAEGAAVPMEAFPGETHLTNIQRLTHGGSNAEAYFSDDGTRLIFQATRAGESECDQIYTMRIDGTDVRRISQGGRTTCGYFFPTSDRLLYSSTHHVSEQCPAPPDRSLGYVWALDPYDVFTANPDGSDIRQITDSEGYDAEATVSPDGSTIIFTSDRDGDLDLYTMDMDGGNVQRLTTEVGYDGGAFFSADGSKIVYRADHPTDPAEIAEFQELLEQGIVRPDAVEIFVMNADGSNKRQLTDNGAANFAPFFHPNGRQIIFSSNVGDPSGRVFNLYLMDAETGEVEQVTHGGNFNSFPMFSPDGSKIVFASDRGASDPREINIFIADWVE